MGRFVDLESSDDDDDVSVSPATFLVEHVLQERWECLVCRVRSPEDLSMEKLVLQCCQKVICRMCLRRSIAENAALCPVTLHPSHPLGDLDVVGNTTSAQWCRLEQEKAWRGAGGGENLIRCSAGECHEVIPCPAAGPRDIRCPRCDSPYCRRCQLPWLEDHLCEDLRRDRAAAENIDRRNRAVLLARPGCFAMFRPWFCGLWQVAPGASAQVATDAQLDDLQRQNIYKQCPKCAVLVDRTGGCNIMRCPNDNYEWCFACGRDLRHGCSHFVCSLYQ